MEPVAALVRTRTGLINQRHYMIEGNDILIINIGKHDLVY